MDNSNTPKNLKTDLTSATATEDDPKGEIDLCTHDDILISKENFITVSKLVFGDAFDDERKNSLIEVMSPDEDGNITYENFLKAFSFDNWPDKYLTTLQEVLLNSKSEEFLKQSDWQLLLSKLGLDIDDDQAEQKLFEASYKCAVELLNLAIDKMLTKDELKSKISLVMDIFNEKLNEVQIE